MYFSNPSRSPKSPRNDPSGVLDGAAEVDGTLLEDSDGALLGDSEGDKEGLLDGATDGTFEGDSDGTFEEAMDGALVGSTSSHASRYNGYPLKSSPGS